MTSTSQLSPAARPVSADGLASLRRAFTGALVTPDDAGYDEARRIWNGKIDRRPAAVARCATSADVAAVVRWAGEHGALVAVRGGGHSAAGFSTCDGGVVIDLSPMKAIAVDPAGRRAEAGGGVTWGELDAATQPHGLAAPGGVFSRTGIAGLTLGGGYGWLRSTYGLACDNLVAAEVVTADGRVIVAEEGGDHADLLWGLRGGGGNFGVVTRFTFRLHPVGPKVYFAVVLHDGEGEAMERALRFFRDWCAAAPEAVSPIAVCGIVPSEGDAYPAAAHGRPFVMFAALYAGPPAEGERVLAPLRDYAEPLVDFSGVTTYVEAQQLWDPEYPDGLRYYWKSLNLPRLDDEAIRTIAEHARAQPSPLNTTDIWFVGGATRREPAGGSAFRGRDAVALYNLEANWTDPADDAANVRWAREAVAAMERFSDGSRYLNFAGLPEDGDARTQVRDSFGPHHGRLVALKRRYDPGNLFRLNQNIDPVG